MKLLRLALLIPPSTSGVERGFSIMNLIVSRLRTSHRENNIDQLMFFIVFFCWFVFVCMVCIGVSIASQKHPLFLAKPPLNQQTVQAPLLGNPPCIWFFVNPPESRIFQWTPKILKFLIVNSILSFNSN